MSKKPLVNTHKTIEDIVGPYMEYLQEHWQYAIKCPIGVEFEAHMKRASASILRNRDTVAQLMTELRENGFYPDIHERRQLQFIRQMTDANKNQIDIDSSEDKLTPKDIGLARLAIVKLVYSKAISTEKGLELQGLPDKELLSIKDKLLLKAKQTQEER